MIKRFTSDTQRKGERGEKAAVLYLQQQGFVVVECNISNKYGEIDIIAKKNKHFYFFEVKTGMLGGWCNPAENMTKTKISKFLVSIRHYAMVNAIAQYSAQLITVKLSYSQTLVPVIEVLSLE